MCKTVGSCKIEKQMILTSLAS